MNEYRIQQKCSLWIEYRIDANSLEEALEKAEEAEDFIELHDTWSFSNEYFAMDENRKELELPKGWK